MRWIVASGPVGLTIMAYIAAFHHRELVATEDWMTTLGITGFALLSGALVAVDRPCADHEVATSCRKV